MNEEKKLQNNMLNHVKIKENLKRSKEELIKNYLIMNFVVETIPLSAIMFDIEKDLINYALLISEQNQKKAAFLLGLKPSTLCEKIKKFRLKPQKIPKDKVLLDSLHEIATFFSKPED